MKPFRKLIFWIHLTCGVTCGIVIFIMCVTGALLAFEKNITEYAERDVRAVSVSDAQRLPVSELLAKVTEAKPDAKPSTIVVQNDPDAAVAVSLGRDSQVFIDPYTGAITGESSKGVRSFFRTVTDAHRYLAMYGDGRPVGKAITGLCNVMFLILAVSGIYIWMPRTLNWRRIKPVLWFRRTSSSKARDFNWHNVIGFWCSLVLIVLTLTAVVISYQWAGNLLYTITGNEPPRQQNSPIKDSSAEQVVIPDNLDTLWSRAEQQSGGWRSISLKLPVTKEAVFTIDEGRSWNMFGRSTLTFDTLTAEIVKWEPYTEQNSGRQLRSWFRFSHTGEIGGIVGQFVGFAACIGGAFLVYTGLALAFRRLIAWARRRSLEDLITDYEG